jgi:hypothetical protein
MPSSGDPNNLLPNLDTLSMLEIKPGSKLSYNEKTGRFSIHEAGKLQGIGRAFSKNSVLNEAKFGAPIREIFAAAHTAVDDPTLGIRKAHIDAALRGLLALADTYAGEPDKRAIMDAVYRDAQAGARKDSAVLINLRAKYQNYVLFGFTQGMFTQSAAGVCFSFTVHWARRILLGKPNFGFSKHTGQSPPILTLEDVQKRRMKQKIDRAIAPMHKYIKTQRAKHYGEVVVDIASAGTNDRYAKYYTELAIYPSEHEVPIDAHNQIGSWIINQVVQIAITEQARTDASVFVVALKNYVPPGHSIGIHVETTPNGSIEPGALHFFDPNIGEFLFPPGSDHAKEEFLNEWWALMYRRENFYCCRLECVSLQQHIPEAYY